MPDNPPPQRPLLPFPWIFATRRLAREIIERNEQLRQAVAETDEQNKWLRGEVKRLRDERDQRWPARPAQPAQPARPVRPSRPAANVSQFPHPGARADSNPRFGPR